MEIERYQVQVIVHAYGTNEVEYEDTKTYNRTYKKKEHTREEVLNTSFSIDCPSPSGSIATALNGILGAVGL